jgi:autotransporter translocation and assembly factor TamB
MPVLSTPFDVKLKMKSSIAGSWQSFKAMIENDNPGLDPIKVAITLAATDIKAPQASFLEDSWYCKSALLVHPNKDIECKKLSLHSSFSHLESSFTYSSKNGIEKLITEVNIADLSKIQRLYPFALSGRLSTSVMYKDLKGTACVTLSDLVVANQSIHDAKFSAKASRHQDTWLYTVKGGLWVKDLDFRLNSSILSNAEGLRIKDLTVSTSDASLDVSGVVAWKKMELDCFLHAPSLRIFRSLLPVESNLDGAIGGQLRMTDDDFRAHFVLKNGRYFDKFISSASIDYKTDSIFELGNKKIDISASNLLIKNIFISDINLRSEQNGTSSPFYICTNGMWKEKVRLHSIGSWNRQQKLWTISFDTIEGEVLRKKFSSANPFSLEIGPNVFTLNSMLMKTGEGQLMLDWKITDKTGKLSCKAEHLPLDILTISQPGVFLEGSTSFDGMLDLSDKISKGYVNLTIEQADISQQGIEKNFQAKGSLQAHLDNGQVQIFSHIYGKDQQFIDATASLPIDIQFNPFRLTLSDKRAISGELTCEGALESIFDFINIGSQKMKGLITSHLFLSRSLYAPSLQGEIDIQNGQYENYISGTRLKKIQAKVIADNDSLRIQSCLGEGKSSGSFSIEGQMVLSPSEKFPFRLSSALKDFKIVDHDIISAYATGTGHMVGNFERSQLSGDIKLTQTNIFISEKIPEEIYQLDVRYVNRPIHLEGINLSPKKPYPMDYDINIATKDPLHITGRGLNSDWKGNIRISGSNTQPVAQGKVNLLKGDVIFAGKKFDLTQGEIMFTDRPNSPAFIKITGNLQLSDMQVQVLIQGPIESPTFTLQSIPYMPTSAILSRVLFNKDIAEINAVQALQLANVIVSMSGANGPDLLETIRRSIGVDRLTIIGKDGSDEISLQIGWYLTHGVTVSISQSATSSDVTVEVDLKHGFIFQAESQNQEEGKFSLKWNKNY